MGWLDENFNLKPFSFVVQPLGFGWLSSISSWTKNWTWHTTGPVWLQFILVPVYGICYAVVNLFVLLFGVLQGAFNFIVSVVSFLVWGVGNLFSFILTLASLIWNFLVAFFANHLPRVGATVAVFVSGAILKLTDFIDYLTAQLSTSSSASNITPNSTSGIDGIYWFFFNYLDLNHFLSVVIESFLFFLSLLIMALGAMISVRISTFLAKLYK